MSLDGEKFGTIPKLLPTFVTNIFSLAQMVDHHPVTYNLNKKDAFIVHLPHKSSSNEIQMDSIFTNHLKSQSLEPKLKPILLILWRRTRSSIHSISLNEPSKLENYFTLSLGATPSINDMKAIIRMNTIKNNPFTTEDIDIAKKIFGPDISSLKGKTTRHKPVAYQLLKTTLRFLEN